ncbi:hypothetical protein R5R35_013846 [Gryllus longicercus]|uniref:Mitochondrial ribosomal protein L1 n=1 Tax=Gryllus longicercus TaxID=2509291 RepID=A0AAN9VBZ4_9ORTH
MASCAVNFMKLFNFKSYQLVTSNLTRVNINFIQVRDYAARRGTREKRLKLLRAKKNSKKPEEKTKGKKLKGITVQPVYPRIQEELKPSCIDDVVVTKYYRWKLYDFAEAIQCHRETHHPTVYNQPDSYVQAHIELDMTAAKKNRFVDNFSRLATVAHPFPMGDPRSVIVFCKTSELQNEAKEAGANLVGDSSLIREIEKGNVFIKDFDHVLAHPNVLPEMVSIRGLMRKTFPNARAGTLGVDLTSMIKRFRDGIRYSAQKDEHWQDFGLIKVNIGKLDMEIEHLQENLQNVLRDIHSVRPKRKGPFITKVLICSAPSVEKFKLNLAALLPELASDLEEASDSDEDEEDEGDMRKRKMKAISA